MRHKGIWIQKCLLCRFVASARSRASVEDAHHWHYAEIHLAYRANIPKDEQ